MLGRVKRYLSSWRTAPKIVRQEPQTISFVGSDITRTLRCSICEKTKVGRFMCVNGSMRCFPSCRDQEERGAWVTK